MAKKENRIGEKYITNEGYEVEIVEYFDAKNCTIKFEDNVIIKNVQYGVIKKGEIKNLNHKSVFGVGFFGQGKYKTSFQYINTEYSNSWRGMLRRCYDSKFQEKNPTYKDVTVCEEWHNFQNFAQWFNDNYVEGWSLDKDILIKGNKIYSPETCCFVPNEINMLFIKCDLRRGEYPIGVCKYKHGKYQAQLTKNSKLIHLGYFDTSEEAFQAYKTAKETYIKEIAEKYKNQITEQVYQALINYQVEITD